MGAVRTTFAMVAACIVRRKQLIAKGLADPYAVKQPASAAVNGIGPATVWKIFFYFHDDSQCAPV